MVFAIIHSARFLPLSSRRAGSVKTRHFCQLWVRIVLSWSLGCSPMPREGAARYWFHLHKHTHYGISELKAELLHSPNQAIRKMQQWRRGSLKVISPTASSSDWLGFPCITWGLTEMQTKGIVDIQCVCVFFLNLLTVKMASPSLLALWELYFYIYIYISVHVQNFLTARVFTEGAHTLTYVCMLMHFKREEDSYGTVVIEGYYCHLLSHERLSSLRFFTGRPDTKCANRMLVHYWANT